LITFHFWRSDLPPRSIDQTGLIWKRARFLIVPNICANFPVRDVFRWFYTKFPVRDLLRWFCTRFPVRDAFVLIIGNLVPDPKMNAKRMSNFSQVGGVFCIKKIHMFKGLFALQTSDCTDLDAKVAV
jgi:hypothetical protein